MEQNSFSLSLCAVALAVVVALVCPDLASTAQQTKPAPGEKVAAANYLVGSWSCTHTIGAFSGKYTTKYTMALGDLWLRQAYDFPPGQFGSKDSPPVTAEALIGYDQNRGQWVRFFASSSGDYFSIRMDYFSIRMKESPTGWEYTYVSFCRPRPDAAQPDATFTKKSDTEYSIDGPSYPENGTQVTEHHSCRKL